MPSVPRPPRPPRPLSKPPSHTLLLQLPLLLQPLLLQLPLLQLWLLLLQLPLFPLLPRRPISEGLPWLPSRAILRLLCCLLPPPLPLPLLPPLPFLATATLANRLTAAKTAIILRVEVFMVRLLKARV